MPEPTNTPTTEVKNGDNPLMPKADILKDVLPATTSEPVVITETKVEPTNVIELTPAQKDAASKEEKPTEVITETKKEEVKPSTEINDILAEIDGIKDNKEVAKPVITLPADKTVTKVDPNARDYTIFPEEVRPFLKKASNEAFQYAVKLQKDVTKLTADSVEKDKKVKELADKHIPDSYYQHPEAYVLSPDFQQASQGLTTISTLESFYKQQMVNIREGKDIQELTFADGKFGALPARKATPNDEVDIMQKLTQLTSQRTGLQGKVEAMKTGFATRFATDSAFVKGIETQYFSDYEKPDSPAQPKIKEVMSKLPASFQSHPLASLLVKSVVANLEMNGIVQKLADYIKTLKNGNATVAAASKAAGPVQSETVVGKGSAEGTVSIDEFEKAMRG